MRKLFLASLFKDVVQIFERFVDEGLAGKTVTFIPTAALPDKLDFHIKYSKQLLSDMGIIVDELEISTADYVDIVSKLQTNDYIYVAGGNTFFLLQEMKRTGAGTVIKEQVDAGKMFIGESAGAIIAAPDIEYAKDTDNPLAAPHLDSYESLNMIEFYPVPHYKDHSLGEKVELVISKYKELLPLFPFSNSQAILVSGDQKQIVTNKE